MSHANGLIRFKRDNKIMFFEYDGTSDMCRPKLWPTYFDLREHWREKDAFNRACDCPISLHEPVEAYTDYGSGYVWETIACRGCQLIIDTSVPDEVVSNIHPQWTKFEWL